MLDICEEEDWDFLEATKEGKAPLEISDLRTIEYVLNVTEESKLAPLKRGRITDEYSTNIAESGSPSFYYLTEGDTINVFSANTADTFLVRYWKVPEELSGTKEPLMPKRWHSLVVDAAVARAYRSSDDWELSNAAKATFEAEFQKMRESLLDYQHDGPEDRIVITDPAALS